MRIDLATADDHVGIDRLVTEAFGSEEGPAVARMVREIRAGDLARPEFELVARDDDGVARGHVMLSGCHLHEGPTPASRRAPRTQGASYPRIAPSSRIVLMLSPLAVAPASRERTLGSRLVESAIARADSRGELLIALAGDPAFYRRFGFEPGSRLDIRVPVPDWAPEESGQVRLLSSATSGADDLRGSIAWPESVPED